jgi:membrane-bound ClpP family serine protease
MDVFVRYSQDKNRGFRTGRIIAGIVLIIIGAAFMFSAVNWWPLIIIAVGIAAMVGGLIRRSSDK